MIPPGVTQFQAKECHKMNNLKLNVGQILLIKATPCSVVVRGEGVSVQVCLLGYLILLACCTSGHLSQSAVRYI